MAYKQSILVQGLSYRPLWVELLEVVRVRDEFIPLLVVTRYGELVLLCGFLTT